jgi:hypothetical protein
MISPVKGVLGPGYAQLDARLMAAVHLRFGLPGRLPPEVKAAIKRADTVSAWLEATRIAGFSVPRPTGSSADPRRATWWASSCACARPWSPARPSSRATPRSCRS